MMLHGPRLDSILAGLRESSRYPIPTVSYCLLLALTTTCILLFSRPRKGDHARAALQALLTVLVPRCSLWPTRYIRFASASRSRVDIPIEAIIEDTIDGVIEFRNIDNLVDLMDPGAAVNGYIICIKIGWKWWINCFEWWILAKVGQPASGACMRWLSRTHCIPDCPPLRMPATNTCPSRLTSNPFTWTSSSSSAVFCLDYFPHGALPSLNAGCKVTLEFTTFSPSIRMLSTAQIISAIPFISSEHPRRWPRTVVSVLRQLNSSHGPNLAIESLANISVNYEHQLRQVYKSFLGKQKNHKMFAEIWNIRAWRRDMFLVALEAALVRRGWIERWVVQVTLK